MFVFVSEEEEKKGEVFHQVFLGGMGGVLRKRTDL